MLVARFTRNVIKATMCAKRFVQIRRQFPASQLIKLGNRTTFLSENYENELNEFLGILCHKWSGVGGPTSCGNICTQDRSFGNNYYGGVKVQNSN